MWWKVSKTWIATLVLLANLLQLQSNVMSRHLKILWKCMHANTYYYFYLLVYHKTCFFLLFLPYSSCNNKCSMIKICNPWTTTQYELYIHSWWWWWYPIVLLKMSCHHNLETEINGAHLPRVTSYQQPYHQN